jgi:hypothetical protein
MPIMMSPIKKRIIKGENLTNPNPRFTLSFTIKTCQLKMAK